MQNLKQVNLISGKNNSGKTALLEALRIWACGADNTVINAILKERGEFTSGWNESYASLFNAQSNKDTLTINNINIKRIVDPNGLQTDYFPFLSTNNKLFTPLNPNVSAEFPKDTCVFIPFLTQHFPLEQLWKKVSLTPGKDKILEFLKQIDSEIVDLDIRADGVLVRHNLFPRPISLGRLGDGVFQVLKIALGMVNAQASETKLLLLDEIEAGLHHSVQKLMWEKVFQYALELDVQVFSTTHSQDSVRSFSEVSADARFSGLGAYFRLERDKDEKIHVISYSDQELATSLELDLETR